MSGERGRWWVDWDTASMEHRLKWRWFYCLPGCPGCEIERLREREREVRGEWEAQCERARFLRADIERLRGVVADARTVIGRGVDLMTNEQVGQWEGVRTWLELEASDE